MAESDEDGQPNVDQPANYVTDEPYRFSSDKSSIVEQILRTDDLLNQVSNFLLGYYSQNGALKQNKKMRLINEKGCRAILFEVGMRISTPATLGTITEEEAKKRAELFEKSLALKLVNNFDDWEVPNTTSMDIIVDTLGDLIFIALTRPISGSTFSGIVDMSQIRQHTLQRDYMMDSENKGFMNKLFGKNN